MIHAPELRVFVNGKGVSVSPGSSALDVVRIVNAESANEVEAGTARLTDSRGLPLDPASKLSSGHIIRVVPVRQRSIESEAQHQQQQLTDNSQ